ncbi:hypothetical protein NGRA_1472 [Nosema granulosis]|uniref:Uncharacterized protein n=1 Tax=Nosema granulosis TaxID=83296 RepID=A0A9P6GYG5_9MICR|nr:hypothetical protein NGRA_1472 [Nosema granulosis]
MRGSGKNKAIYECNQHIKKAMYYGEVLFNVMVLIFYAYNKCYGYSKFIFTTIPEMICVLLIMKISKPKIDKEDGAVVLSDPGVDLSGKGFPSILFDSLVVCMIVKILIVFSYFSLFIYLLIPISMGYEFIYKPYRVFNKYD